MIRQRLAEIDARNLAILAFVEAGHTQAEAAAKFSVTRRTICYAISRAKHAREQSTVLCSQCSAKITDRSNT